MYGQSLPNVILKLAMPASAILTTSGDIGLEGPLLINEEYVEDNHEETQLIKGRKEKLSRLEIVKLPCKLYFHFGKYLILHK